MMQRHFIPIRRSRWLRRVLFFQVLCAGSAWLSTPFKNAWIVAMGVWVAAAVYARCVWRQPIPIGLQWKHGELYLLHARSAPQQICVNSAGIAVALCVLLPHCDAVGHRGTIVLFADQFSEPDYAALLRWLHWRAAHPTKRI